MKSQNWSKTNSSNTGYGDLDPTKRANRNVVQTVFGCSTLDQQCTKLFFHYIKQKNRLDLLSDLNMDYSDLSEATKLDIVPKGFTAIHQHKASHDDVT